MKLLLWILTEKTLSASCVQHDEIYNHKKTNWWEWNDVWCGFHKTNPVNHGKFNLHIQVLYENQSTKSFNIHLTGSD